MSLPGANTGTAFTTPTCVNAWIEYPFRDQGDSATKVYVHTMQVLATSYAPLSDDDEMTAADEKPERSPFSDDANAFFVGDSVPRNIDGGMVEFTRSFANIPADRTIANGKADPFGLYAFEFPDTATISSTYVSTGGETFSHNAATHTSTMTFDLSAPDIANLSVGDLITVRNTASAFFVKYDLGLSVKTIYTSYASRCEITNKTATTITCEYVWGNYYDASYVIDSGDDKDGVAATTYQAIKTELSGRGDTLQANSPAFIESTYVKSNDVYSLNASLNKKFAVYNSSGSLEDGQDLSSTTVPTNEEYGNLVLNGLTINAEDQTIERWKGNIFCLRSIRVIAK